MKLYQVIKNVGYPEAEIVHTTNSINRAYDMVLELDQRGYPSTYILKRDLVGLENFVFRGEVVGKIYSFEGDITINTDLSGEITDHSGCGYKTALALLDTLPEELK
jgi:hypothetical protein